MGTTEVPTNPETIVSFSPAFTDAFAAMGRPVELEFRADGFDGDVPWSGEAAGELGTYGMGADGIAGATEEIAAANPDVIFAGWLPDEATYNKLNAIAPTVAVIGENPWTDDWRKSTEIAGEVIGKADEAKDLVADAEQAIADARENHPALEGATAAFGQASPQGTALVTADEDPANVFLTDLGMVIPEEIKEVSEEGGRAYISDENSDLLNTDFLAMWNAGADAADTINGWDDLKAVKDGSSVVFEGQDALAMSQPSVLAVPWLVEHLEEQFAALDDAAE
ncbi:MAG TPA: ABC transporter substrate-binding protein [Candidatus Corynebacterium avicola]|uniref:ABC transporter substrate-binding protein n=1 Tax=Candidatus Corynebacterium avicola TaxID=2838527 RepID=A0A9D1RNT6_9CORY|nr:ABC transporter substrate-binding protein [Candidatus Corynebacterium avicola]